MRFFTIEWWAGYQTADSVDEAEPINAYRAHLLAIRDRLPPELVALQETISLHDAKFLGLEVRGERAVLRLTLNDGRGVELQYGGLTSFDSVHTPDKTLDNAGYGDLGYDEIDVHDDGSSEHRILFASSIELRLRFATLDLRPMPPVGAGERFVSEKKGSGIFKYIPDPLDWSEGGRIAGGGIEGHERGKDSGGDVDRVEPVEIDRGAGADEAVLPGIQVDDDRLGRTLCEERRLAGGTDERRSGPTNCDERSDRSAPSHDFPTKIKKGSGIFKYIPDPLDLFDPLDLLTP